MTHHLQETSRRARMEEIAAVDLFDPRLRAELDVIAREVAEDTGHPVSLITIIAGGAQITIGAHGLSGDFARIGGLPAEWSFCLHVVLDRGELNVPDLGAHPVFAQNPLVAMDLVKSYAGVPLTTASGEVLGAHCVISPLAGACTEADLERLRGTVDRVLAVLETYRR